MTIKVTCTECRATYELPDAMAGQTGECECGATFVIPLASEGYASLDNGASAVNVNEDNDEPQNAFAAPQVAEVSELQLADFTDSDKAGLMRLMTGLKLIAWIPGVALIGVAVSFLVGLMIGGCDGLGAFIYLVGTTAFVTGILVFVGYIFLAMSPSESGARPYFHAAFWLSIFLDPGAAFTLDEVFGNLGDEGLYLAGSFTFAICSALGATGMIKVAGYIRSSRLQNDWTGFRLTCLIASAVSCLAVVVMDDEETAGWIMGLGGIFVLIYGWTTVITTRQTVNQVIAGDSAVAANETQS